MDEALQKKNKEGEDKQWVNKFIFNYLILKNH